MLSIPRTVTENVTPDAALNDAAAIEDALAGALEEAGLAGLCEEGQIEVAVGQVAVRFPNCAREALIEAALEHLAAVRRG